MSDFSVRKQSIITVSSDAKSKKLDETLKKLSAIKAESKANTGKNDKPIVSAEPANTENGGAPSLRKGLGLKSLRVTSAPQDNVSSKEVSEEKKAPVVEKKDILKAPMVASDENVKTAKSPALTLSTDKIIGMTSKATPTLTASALTPSMDMRAPKRPDEMFAGDADNEPVLMLSPKNSVPVRRSIKYKVVNFIALFMTAGWLTLTVLYINGHMGWIELFSQQPHILGGFLAGILAPVALLWMVLAHLQRGADIQMYADALRGELQAMIFPSEERSEVIHKDIEALCAQAAELSASSKTVLNSIHRARIGLRNEIRDFSGLSKKTEFHIDRLADSLGERSMKLIELTDEIEKRTTSLDAKTLSGAKAWDDAAISILSRASEIESAMEKGADKIVKAANEADITASNINVKLQGSFDVLKESVDSVKSVTGHTVSAIMEASKTIEDNRDTLGDGAKLLAEKASEITATLNGSVSSIQDSVDEMVAKTDNIEDRLEGHVGSLNTLIEDMDSKIGLIETAGSETAHKLSEAMVSAISGADNISSSVRRATETLGKATSEANEQAESFIVKATDKIASLNELGTSSAENIKNVLGLIDDSREQMQDASQMVEVQVEKLSAAIEMQTAEIAKAQDNLNDRVESIQLSMTEPLEAMSRAVDNASIKHEEIEKTLSRRITDLNAASDKAVMNAKDIREGLRAQAQEISTVAGQVAGHSKSVQSMMQDQADDLSQNISGVLDRIETVGQALEVQSDKLTTLSQTAEDNITQLKGSISEQCDEVANNTDKVVGGLKELDNVLDKKLTTLIDHSSEARHAVEKVASSLLNSADIIEPIYMQATNQVKLAQASFERMSASFEDGTASNLDKLKSMGVLFDERMQTLTVTAEDASRVLNNSSESLGNRVDDIETATKSAGVRMRDMETLFKNQASDIHLTTDQALLKIDGIQKALNDQFHDLSETVGVSIAQIDDVGQQLTRQTKLVADVSDAAIEKFDAAGAKAKEQTHELKEMAKSTVNEMGNIVKRVKIESKQLLDTSSQTLTGLKKSGDSFALRAKEVSELMKSSLKTTQEYGDELDKRADQVAEASHHSVDKISEAISALSGKMQEVKKAANDTTGKIERSCEKLSSETAHLADVSVKASRVVDEASSSYVRQSEALAKASQDATNQADKIRQSDLRIQRESFMGSAKFVLESLHSLSVDLTRMTEGGVQEKVWKTYQKGDVAAFTARLLEIEDKIPMKKMQDKYGVDNEFRTYVNRFIRQFEDVYEQAHNNDHGELISTTFASSDIGKLYEILCDIAGRRSLVKKLTSRAA